MMKRIRNRQLGLKLLLLGTLFGTSGCQYFYDGSAPMCFPKAEYMTGPQDVLVGEIGGLPFFMNGEQYKLWKHTNLIIDAIKGGGGMFSLDNGTGQRFLTRSEICNIPEV